jgi:tRNA uridine 5-carbamoylmethylation protein Kti12
MAERILVMGLPGSGKTYFAERLKTYLEQHGTINNVSPERALCMEHFVGDYQVRYESVQYAHPSCRRGPQHQHRHAHDIKLA